MKIDRYGQAKILTPEEIQLLFTQGLTKERDRVLTKAPVFGICLYGTTRIREACTLLSFVVPHPYPQTSPQRR